MNTGFPIHLAASMGHLDVVTWLLKKEADVNAHVTRGEKNHYNVLLAACYANGDGVQQDTERALELYLDAAEGGSRDAMNNLGIMYDKGRGVAASPELAASWFERAADKGNAEAVHALALMQVAGRGTERDMEAAAARFEWLMDRKGDDYPNAIFMLGVMKLKGEGLERDYAGALPLIRRAANLGLNAAQTQLAMLDQTAVSYLTEHGDPFVEGGPLGGEDGDAGRAAGGGEGDSERRRKKTKKKRR